MPAAAWTDLRNGNYDIFCSTRSQLAITSVHNLDTGLNYTTIQVAIDAPETLNGHTILVDAGTYYENLVVTKSISLIGENSSNTIIDGGGPTYADISSSNKNNMAIRGFTLQNGYFGISLYSSTNPDLSENIIKDNQWGIYFNDIYNATISGNNITNSVGQGIQIEQSSYANISGNIVTNNGYSAIYIRNSSENTIFENTLTNNTFYGVDIYMSQNNNVTGNNITENNSGVYIQESSNTTIISNNTIQNNNLNGVYIRNSSNNTVSENNIPNNLNTGIYLLNSSNNILSTNNITSTNGRGISISRSTNNSLSGNIMSNNSYPLNVGGFSLSDYIQDIDDSNTVDGKPVYYWVSKDNMTIPSDAGYVALINCTKITVENQTLTRQHEGILLAYTTNSSIINNTLTDNYSGIALRYSTINTISDNSIVNNTFGIILFYSTNNSLSGNVISDNSYNLNIGGSSLSDYIQDIDATNTVEGKPVYYWVSKDNMTVPSDAGYVALINCTKITVENLILTRQHASLLLAYTTSSTITNNTLTDNYNGIYLRCSRNNTISGNTLTTNSIGLYFYNSSYNNISNNNIANSTGFFGSGISFLNQSSNNIIRRNNITDNNRGLYLAQQSSNNSISENELNSNNYGIWLSDSNDNMIYHNNFIDNTAQTSVTSSNCTWDDSYPSGGNYWSDYSTIDIYSGPNQDEPGSDGIWDNPYIIDTENQDSYPMVNPWTPELSLDGLTSWYWIDNTTINAVDEGDVDNDGLIEVVTGGYYFDGTRDVAQLVVWNGSTLTVDRLTTWYWINNTRINSVAVGNLDEDEALEIVTGGYYHDGTRKVAQLVIWDGATLAVEGLTTWYWTSDTEINSVKVEDVDGDGSAEIITAGYYNDGARDVAQLVVWNATTFEVENIATWYWTGDTRINSIDVENVDVDVQLEIITGGYYTGEQKIAQLVVWDGLSLAPENIASWYWTSDTEINSVVAANVDDDTEVEIVTGGYYNDNSRDIAQLVIWSSDLQSVENLAGWYWTGDTRINSIEVGDVDSDGSAEIITGGYYNDLSRDVAQLVVWDGSTLAVDYVTAWYWTGDTCICSVAVGNVDGDVSSEIITGGSFHDNTRTCAQTTIWEIS